MTSLAKAEANRQNALKSTGPRTERGKTKSRRNATKYGQYTSIKILNEENDAEFKALLKDLKRDLQPVGIAEERCVVEIAACYWRQTRNARAEGYVLNNHYRAALRAHFQRMEDLAGHAIGAEIEKHSQDGRKAASQECDGGGDPYDSLLTKVKKLARSISVNSESYDEQVAAMLEKADPLPDLIDAALLETLVPMFNNNGDQIAQIDAKRAANARELERLYSMLDYLQARRKAAAAAVSEPRQARRTPARPKPAPKKA